MSSAPPDSVRPVPTTPPSATSARLAEFRQDLARAWRHRPVRRGLLGSAGIVLGSLTPAYLPQNSPWWDLVRGIGLDNWFGRALGTALVGLGAALLIEAWFRLRPSLYHEVKHWPVTLLWSLPMLFAPPIFSHDAYAYAGEGWLLQNGLNPYLNPISVLPGAFADQTVWLWRYTTAMYPPLSLEMFHGLVALAGNDPYFSTLAMRLPALLGVGLITIYLPRIADKMGADPAMTAWFSAINPVLIIDLVGGAHNDALMMGLVVFALWLVVGRPGVSAAEPELRAELDERAGYDWRFWLAGVVVGVAACIKQPAILAFYPVALVGHPWNRLRWPDTWAALRRLTLSLATAVGTFAAITAATGLGYGWIQAADVPGKVLTLAPFSLVGAGLRFLLETLGRPATGQLAMDSMRYLGLGLTVVAIGWLGITTGRRRPITFLSWSYLIFAFGGIALNSWYLTWGGLLLPLARPGKRIIGTAVTITTVLLAYGAGSLAWRNEMAAIGCAALAALGILLYRHIQEHNRIDSSAADA